MKLRISAANVKPTEAYVHFIEKKTIKYWSYTGSRMTLGSVGQKAQGPDHLGNLLSSLLTINRIYVI
jgi:hypothetical protein